MTRGWERRWKRRIGIGGGDQNDGKGAEGVQRGKLFSFFLFLEIKKIGLSEVETRLKDVVAQLGSVNHTVVGREKEREQKEAVFGYQNQRVLVPLLGIS